MTTIQPLGAQNTTSATHATRTREEVKARNWKISRYIFIISLVFMSIYTLRNYTAGGQNWPASNDGAVKVGTLSDAAQADLLKSESQAAARAAASEAAARVAAAEVERLAAVPTDAVAGPCLLENTEKLNCETVVFGYNTKYDRTAFYDEAKGIPYCINQDGGDSVKEIPLGGNQFRYIGPEGLVVQFFDLALGDTYRGSTCGS